MKTLLVERLQWTPTQRLLKHENILAQIEELRKTALEELVKLKKEKS